MKKLLVTIIVLVLSLSFSACKNEKDKDKSGTTNDLLSEIVNGLEKEQSEQIDTDGWNKRESYEVNGIKYEVPAQCVETYTVKDNTTYFYPDFGMIMIHVSEDLNVDFSNYATCASYANAFSSDGVKVTNYHMDYKLQSQVLEMDFEIDTDTGLWYGTSMSISINGDIISFYIYARYDYECNDNWDEFQKYIVKANEQLQEEQTTYQRVKTTTTTTTTTKNVQESPILYNDDMITVKYARSSNKMDRMEVYFYVENKTTTTLTIQADAITLNGYCFSNIIMSDPVPGGTTGIVNATVQEYDSSLVGTVSSVGGQLRYFDDYRNIHVDALMASTKIDGSGTQGLPGDPPGNCLYSNNDVSVYYKSAEKPSYRNDSVDVYLYFINKSNRTLTIQCDAITLNGYSFSNVIVSDPVTPQSIGIVNVSVNDFDFGLVDINNVQTLGGQFRIITDYNFADSYDIVF